MAVLPRARRSAGEILAPYVAFAAKAFSREATYRMEVFTNVGSLLVRLYLMKAVWTALYAQNAAPAGVSLHMVLTYTTIALLMSLVLEIDGTRAIRDKIREGTIATDLMKPISLPLYFFSDGIGMTLLHATLIIPALVMSLFIVRIDVPSPAVLAAFALSFVLGYLVNFTLNFLMNCVAFWTLESFAAQLMVRWISDLLGGQIVPLIFFPGVLQQIVLALPFAAVYSTPLLIYVGTIPPSGYALALAVQLGWFVVFSAIGIVVWRAAQRRVVVQGG
ncbi:MAG TPA: ABC-2 family transporter protein [Candidatus Limnocylindria bacterium]|jgi:ABC-2 type transport system permease protein|nr:ABC-2 family transporter protein [Candidatus Limnocylindria bacterium]